MEKKKTIPIAVGIAIAVGLLVTIVSNQNLPTENNSTDKIGLVINTPTTRTTLEELDQVYSKATSSGIGRTNAYLFWNIVEPTKGEYNWDQTDILMSFTKKNDLNVTLYFSLINGNTLGPFPSWMGKPSLISVSEDRLVKVLDAILSRYDIIDTVIISGETESHFRYSENEIPVYKELFENVYDRIKEKHPNVKIGNAFSLHHVLNKNLEHIVKELAIGDFVAFSYFPVDSLNDIVKTPMDAKQDLNKAFELSGGKQIAFFEISWSTSEFIGGNKTSQKQFVEESFSFFDNNESKIEFFTWYRLYDKAEEECDIKVPEDEGSVSVGGGSGLGSSEFVVQRLEHYICDVGLLTVNGDPKPSWNEFFKEINNIS
ncbi:MAG: hypothetical protein GWN01_02910 [Nitrosopumilaceae archaeon]|nr:hypothetical protein [Nitrosopumilaceae archaeon]NIT99916.1 hypothetical protein [Nitrosopumilaceae archaeon]NIU86269.1 hypothetical protein [Nitrosopumilaceae archaeon]NIV65024.1 hypothetical protein [Nitrosopumilaceae archaeon]NIX60519.1 hypothetical protein [Nitrosopumilaceae archaeon]